MKKYLNNASLPHPNEIFSTLSTVAPTLLAAFYTESVALNCTFSHFLPGFQWDWPRCRCPYASVGESSCTLAHVDSAYILYIEGVTHMHIQSLGYIQFKTHQVAVSRDLDNSHILCFKSTNSRCEWESFSTESAAVDYIVTPMPNLVYQLVLAGDQPN